VSAVDEHLATRRAAGLFDFSFMGVYEFHKKSELQALQTRNLDEVKPGQAVYTLLLKDDGAVLIDATVWRLNKERYWLFTGRRGAYGGHDASGAYTIFALQGPSSGYTLSYLIGPDAVQTLKYFHFVEKDDLIVARLGFSGELGYEILVPAADAAALREKILERGRPDVRECTWAAADSLRIEAGYVLFDREIDGVANPAELGLERLAPGRKFEVKRKLVGLDIIDGQAPVTLPVAKITSECFSPTLGRSIALGYADPRIGVGSGVRLADGRMARIARLPFYDAERQRPRGVPL
jgi:glycine cleavage system aminomethyltransferase T